MDSDGSPPETVSYSYTCQKRIQILSEATFFPRRIQLKVKKVYGFMALVTFSTSSVGLEPARVVFSPILNHTCSEPKYYEILGSFRERYKQLQLL